MIEVARQQVGAAEVVSPLVAALKDEEAAVLEEPIEHAADAYVLAHALDPGAQAADPACDDVDLRACSRGPIELLDHRLVVQRIHLDPDGCSGAGLCGR